MSRGILMLLTLVPSEASQGDEACARPCGRGFTCSALYGGFTCDFLSSNMGCDCTGCCLEFLSPPLSPPSPLPPATPPAPPRLPAPALPPVAAGGLAAGSLIQSHSGPCVASGDCVCSSNFLMPAGACAPNNVSSGVYGNSEECHFNFTQPVFLDIHLFDVEADPGGDCRWDSLRCVCVSNRC